MTTIETNRRFRTAALPAHSVVFTILALLADVLVICGAATVSGIAYHLFTYGAVGAPARYLIVGVITGLIFVLPFLIRGDYRVRTYSGSEPSHGRIFFVWIYAFLCLGIIGFLTKTTHIYSRGWLLIFFFVGLLSLIALNAILERVTDMLIESGRIVGRRMMLIGTPREIRECTEQIVQRHASMNLLATEILPGDLVLQAEAQSLQRMIAEATVRARSLSVDDVVIAIPWQRDDIIQSIVEQFADLPVSVHVGCTRIFRAAPNLHISQFSHLKTITLVSAPLGPLQLLIKRAIDVGVAGTALVLLAPLFFAIGTLIKLSSPGPVFFRQRRGGYNLAEFRIWKFRTMSTLDDGEHIVQAKRNDARVTPIGRFLRRYNLDELPQLINVLQGEMSIVGPRPHALAHDKEATRKIEAYSRRLNVRPGITGWAQVNGFRGPTLTVDLMQARLEHDLYYIENWSLGFDLYILFLTLLSPRAYTNNF